MPGLSRRDARTGEHYFAENYHVRIFVRHARARARAQRLVFLPARQRAPSHARVTRIHPLREGRIGGSLLDPIDGERDGGAGLGATASYGELPPPVVL